MDKEVFKKLLRANEEKKEKEFIDVMMAQHNRRHWRDKKKRERDAASVDSGQGHSSSAAGSDF